MAACPKLWITLPFALESFRFAPANPDCWQRGSEDFCCDQDMKVSTLGTGIFCIFWGKFFLLSLLLGGGNSNIFIFNPNFGEDEPILSRGLKPTTSLQSEQSLCFLF